MRLVFMGSGAFALPTLEWLASSEHEIAAVVTQPARGSGRGMRVTRTPVRAVADKLDLRSIEPEKVNDDEVVRELASLGADLALVIAFGQKVHRPLRDAIPGGCINLHASLLPKYRGAAPINWAIAFGEAVSGCTVFRLVDRMDAGPILAMNETPIGATETAGELHDRLATLGIETVRQAFSLYAAGDVPLGSPQNDDLATSARKLTKSDGNIDFNKPAARVVAHLHGMTPWPGARAKFMGEDDRWENVSILRARVADDSATQNEPGVVTDAGAISAARGTIEVLEIKPSSGRAMTWRDYVNGRQVRAGDRFSSPTSSPADNA